MRSEKNKILIKKRFIMESSKMLKRFRTGASILTALCLVSPLVFADEAVSTDATVKEAFEKDKTGTNPINFTNDARLYNEYRWLNTEGDGSQNLVTAEYRMRRVPDALCQRQMAAPRQGS
jgi:hypothetical protein